MLATQLVCLLKNTVTEEALATVLLERAVAVERESRVRDLGGGQGRAAVSHRVTAYVQKINRTKGVSVLFHPATWPHASGARWHSLTLGPTTLLAF